MGGQIESIRQYLGLRHSNFCVNESEMIKLTAEADQENELKYFFKRKSLMIFLKKRSIILYPYLFSIHMVFNK